MNKVFAVFLVVIFCVQVLIAGCSNGDNGGDNADSDLVVAMSTFSESTFLPWNGSTGRKLYLDAIYEYLVYINPDSGELEPGLARKWTVSDDGLTHTFWLRKGVQFQDGWGEVTAEDAKYTIERMIEPEAIAGPSSPLRALVKDVSAPERYKLVITLTSPDIDFARAYLSNGLVVPIVCKKYVEKVGDKEANRYPVGTGAYRLVSYKKDVSITMQVRQDVRSHWRVIPEFRTIRFLAVPEEFARVAMLKTGEVDLAPINYDSISVVNDAGMKVLYVDNSWAPVIRLGGLVPLFPDPDVPWRDRRVRQAMNYAIDKKAIIESIFHGHAEAVGADFPSPDFMDIPPYPYDPDKARRLLAEAGYPDGFSIRLKTYTTSPGAELPIIAQVVALYWEEVGISTTIEPTNWIALRGAWSTGNARNIGWTHRGLAFTNTLTGLQASVMSRSVFASYADENTDDYIRRIGNSLDYEKRKDLVKELGNYLRDQAAAVYICFADEPFGASRKVGDWPTLSEQSTNIDRISRARR